MRLALKPMSGLVLVLMMLREVSSRKRVRARRSSAPSSLASSSTTSSVKRLTGFELEPRPRYPGPVVPPSVDAMPECRANGAVSMLWGRPPAKASCAARRVSARMVER